MEQKQAVQAIQKKKESGIFQAITLIALALFWVGYAFALYRANERNVSSYFSLIMIFSLINILAKVQGILLFALAVWELISVLLS